MHAPAGAQQGGGDTYGTVMIIAASIVMYTVADWEQVYFLSSACPMHWDKQLGSLCVMTFFGIWSRFVFANSTLVRPWSIRRRLAQCSLCTYPFYSVRMGWKSYDNPSCICALLGEPVCMVISNAIGLLSTIPPNYCNSIISGYILIFEVELWAAAHAVGPGFVVGRTLSLHHQPETGAHSVLRHQHCCYRRPSFFASWNCT